MAKIQMKKGADEITLNKAFVIVCPPLSATFFFIIAYQKAEKKERIFGCWGLKI